jgi:hypothetical protein
LYQNLAYTENSKKGSKEMAETQEKRTDGSASANNDVKNQTGNPDKIICNPVEAATRKIRRVRKLQTNWVMF